MVLYHFNVYIVFIHSHGNYTVHYATFYPVPAQVHVDTQVLEVTFSDDSVSLDYLIPTITGPGVCTVALVYMLVRAHNTFIEKYRREMSKKQPKESGLE